MLENYKVFTKLVTENLKIVFEELLLYLIQNQSKLTICSLILPFSIFIGWIIKVLYTEQTGENQLSRFVDKMNLFVGACA